VSTAAIGLPGDPVRFTLDLFGTNARAAQQRYDSRGSPGAATPGGK